jgi:hypothetical protein
MHLSFPEATWSALGRCRADKSCRLNEAYEFQGDLQHAFAFHDYLLPYESYSCAGADEPDAHGCVPYLPSAAVPSKNRYAMAL